MLDGERQPGEQAIVREILDGLAEPRKVLPPKLFYDEEGCRLFGLITKLDEYYVTRAEMALLADRAEEIASLASQGSTLVEYGASDEAKAELLLRSGRFSAYVPIDISACSLELMTVRLQASRPDLLVQPVAADFLQPFVIPPPRGEHDRFGFFPGSTIGNLEPESVVRFLAEAARTISVRGRPAQFVIGTDLRKDPSLLIPAYDDRDGVTAAFNRNILAHVNAIAAADFDPDRFAHEARWNDAASRIEMHLISRGAQTVIVAGTQVRFASGESIHTESSYKHTRAGFASLAERAGWQAARFWQDEKALFGIHLLRAAPTPAA